MADRLLDVGHLTEGIHNICKELVAIGGVSEGHVANTPTRVVKAYQEMFAGVFQKPEIALNTLFDAKSQEMIHVKEILFFSNCAHHFVPFFGKMSFAYIPDGKIVGLSKIPRLVEVYSKRPQVQEELTSQIVDAFQEIVSPKGCALMARAYHMCCMSRGIKQPTAYTETTELRGVFKTDATVRNEWLLSANSQNWKVL